MTASNEILRRTCLVSFGHFYSRRARRTIPLYESFWMARAYSIHAALQLPRHGAKIIFRLRRLQGHSQQFLKLCENLKPQV
jgi:hypothetical protein